MLFNLCENKVAAFVMKPPGKSFLIGILDFVFDCLIAVYREKSFWEVLVACSPKLGNRRRQAR